MKDIIIAGKKIGKTQPPFIIAEMSANHNQSLERALEIVDQAAACGVHALKLQTYTPDTLTLNINDGDFQIKDSLWKGTSLHRLYEKAYLPWEWHKPIFDRCAKHNLVVFSTPFDETAVDFLETLYVPCYKIASFENVHLPLIRKVAKTGKPLIISTGMATVSEISDAVLAAREAGCQDLILLKCNSGYPAQPEESHVATIPHMKQLFNCHVGLSDHSLGIGVALASIVFGAVIIEKHFTLSRYDNGVDAAFSMEPAEFKNLVIESQRAWQGIGTINYQITDYEQTSKAFRRSLYIAQDIQAGQTLTKENVKIVRPGNGLHPKYFDDILGKKASKNLKKGTPLNWNSITS
ncbi:MAG: pseudaminic acid synthase [bacterium]